ncbi:MAG: hypothetical protein HYV97_06775 [Bdellovibrio sp.]|nr:hypothetical protein [Bdellovibrio sp.]
MLSMTISGLTTFFRQSGLFQALIAGGIVGLAMFTFSHIFQAPVEKHSDLQISAAATTSISMVVSYISSSSVEQVEVFSPAVTVQSWPPTPRGGGILPASDVLHQDLFMVGLSGVIPPPVFTFILPASFSYLLSSLSILNSSTSNNNNLQVFRNHKEVL